MISRHSRSRQRSPVLGLVLAATMMWMPALSARAQAPHESWRTLEVPGFIVHYPQAYEAWATTVAARLGSIRERLVEEIGYRPQAVIEVIVSDPVARPNGSALPFLDGPRMTLWTTPPEPSSVLGGYRDWGELVSLHEDAHLVHLLRPARAPLHGWILRYLTGRDLPPIASKAPRWVSEGYATVLEGRMTGSGRPNSDFRAAILRRRAQDGRLPSYGQLASDSQTWLGQSMAYLAGSAFLEWLEERNGRDSLRHLWRRLTAKEDRGFEAAFAGVFGDSPETLYRRFSAELTWRALEAEMIIASEVDASGSPEPSGKARPSSQTDLRAEVAGEPWQELGWAAQSLTVSPDGRRLAVVVTHRDLPPRLVVWSTANDDEALAKRQQRIEEMIAEDPEDVAPVAPKSPPHREIARLPTLHGSAPHSPRWLPDGSGLIFVRFVPDHEGFLRPDLFRWSLDSEGKSGGVTRLTHQADVRSPDVSPDGRWAIAVRHRHGLSSLVTVDLATGEAENVTEPSLDSPWAQPRISPDGSRLAALRLHRGEWRHVVFDLAGEAQEGQRLSTLGDGQLLANPPDLRVRSHAWSQDGSALWVTAGLGGFIDLWRRPIGDPEAASGSLVRFTRTHGAVLAPDPSPVGDAIYFLALDSDGLDIRRLNLDSAPDQRVGHRLARLVVGSNPDFGSGSEGTAADLAPITRFSTGEPAEPFAVAEVESGVPYRAARQEPSWLVSGVAGASGSAVEGWLAGSDVIGRFDWLLLGSLGRDGADEGLAAAATWRRWPTTFGAHLFAAEQRPSEQDDPPVGRSPRLDVDRWGLELTAHRDRTWPTFELAGGLGVAFGEVELASRSPSSERFALAEALISLHGTPSWGRLGAPFELDLRHQLGETGEDSFTRTGGRLALGATLGERTLRASWTRRESSGARFAFDRFQVGGLDRSLLPSSVAWNRIAVPALEAGALLGERYEGQRIELALLGPDVPLFWQRHRVGGLDAGGSGSRSGDAWAGWLTLVGVEYRVDLEPTALLGVPALDLTAGAAWILDDPIGGRDDELRGWLSIVWRP